MPLAPGIQTVGMALRATLRAARRPAEILDLTQAGLVPLYADALLDDALSTGVALVAVEVNLRLFLDPLARPGWESMPGLVRRLKFGKALRVCQALENQGMTVFDPPLLRLREQLGLLHVFEGARQGALDQLTAIGEQATSALGLPRRNFPPLADSRGARR